MELTEKERESCIIAFRQLEKSLQVMLDKGEKREAEIEQELSDIKIDMEEWTI